MKERWMEITGCIQISKDPDTWLDDFIDWLESRGESFLGVTGKEFDPDEEKVKE